MVTYSRPRYYLTIMNICTLRMFISHHLILNWLLYWYMIVEFKWLYILTHYNDTV